MFVSEESVVPDRDTSTRLDVMVAALAAIYIQGRQPQLEQVEGVAQGIVAAQRLLPGGSPQLLEKGAWTAVCRRPFEAASCSLTLERPAFPRQQLAFSVDRHNRFFNGLAWESESAAYFFQVVPAGAGWSLRCSTVEHAPQLALGPGLPWTATADRGDSEAVPGATELFTALGVVRKIVAAGKQCLRCLGKLPEKAKFCPGCGAPVQNRACPNCRKPIEPEARFCGACGTRCST